MRFLPHFFILGGRLTYLRMNSTYGRIPVGNESRFPTGLLLVCSQHWLGVTDTIGRFYAFSCGLSGFLLVCNKSQLCCC